MKLAIAMRLLFVPLRRARLRFILSYPRVGLNVVPSTARPSLFGCD
jgi:hypothetical protein